MKYLVKNASVSISGKLILGYVNFEINDHDHIGIVGRNGAGKTTLLKALIDNDMFEEGLLYEPFQIQKIGDFKIGYQSQITFENENNTLLEEILLSFDKLIKMEKELDHLTKLLDEDASEKNINNYTNMLESYEACGGYTYKKDYEVMIKKFGFTENDKNKPIKSFSGGEKTKIAFIKLLLSKSDIIFLDEPTNHLDIEAIEWLEEYLKNYKGSFVIVSHDRMFLNNTTNIIYEINNCKTTCYHGNYDFYEKKRNMDYEKALSDYERQQKEIQRLHELYLKFRNKPSKASMALSKLHMIERMEKIDKPEKLNDKAFKTNLEGMPESSRVVLCVKKLEIGYNKLLASLSFEITKGDRIGIIGANGSGKSTLLKTICGIIPKMRGSITFGTGVNLGYFDQDLTMEQENTVLEEFMNFHKEMSISDSRNALGAFLFKGDDVFKKVASLSGGEKVRLLLCKILYNKPNFLILDEPTNHMDIISKKRLEDILTMYKGTILFVSHDRYFTRKIANKLIIFDKEGATIYSGTYDEYVSQNKSKINNEIECKTRELKKGKPAKIKEVNTNKKELEKLEKDIIKLETKKSDLEKVLLDPNIYNDYQKCLEIGKELKIIQEKLGVLNKQWEESIANIIE